MSLTEASKRSGLHVTTILRMALVGTIGFRQRGRRTVFRASDLRRAG